MPLSLCANSWNMDPILFYWLLTFSSTESQTHFPTLSVTRILITQFWICRFTAVQASTVLLDLTAEAHFTDTIHAISRVTDNLPSGPVNYLKHAPTNDSDAKSLPSQGQISNQKRVFLRRILWASNSAMRKCCFTKRVIAHTLNRKSICVCVFSFRHAF